ncbi:MAG: glycosyltransferase [Propionibacteriaceae bacterium]|nr:glycosyltransferase [Propionibacteriaceae bacterium]
MKTITFAVPCYNSEQFMAKCLDSLLACASSDVEIIIVNDGSTDATEDIALGYARDGGGIVSVINQENRGHGGAINSALRVAQGKYFKVIDSDDFVEEAACHELLDALRTLDIDLAITNYVYEKQGKKRKKVIHYENCLPQRRILTWDDVGRFGVGQYLLMHALTYRTAVLRDCGLELPEHTFYVDNLFAYVPMPQVRTLYYLNVDFYRYSIGVEGQSVAEKTMLKRIDQQIAVNQAMFSHVDIDAVDNVKQRDCLLHYLEIITSVTLILLVLAHTPEADVKREQMWAYIEKGYPTQYEFLCHGFPSRLLRNPGRVGRAVAVGMYQVARGLYGFN